ncbi:WG repeat-containing protein, partial [uncultured Thomasclavelia sp.]|uniref:WG repeat-containing protein n=1 Tax=uncultured Thomasclavelia sp. TaxID=3025759 RepID=UPI00280A9286
MKKIRNLILASTILITVGCSNVNSSNSSLDIDKNDVNINSSINSNSENNKYSKEKKLDKYYAYVVNNKKEGVISSDGNVVFECNYDDITLNVTDGKLYGEVTVDGKKGIINEEGDYIINPIYDDIYFGETNEFKVKLNDKFGLIDKNENVIADIIYDKISDFGYNDCAIASVNGEFGFLKNNGEFNVIDGINEISGYFKDKNTLLPAKVGTKWGFINYKGKFKIEPIFDNVSGSFINDNIVTASKDGKCGQINSTGKFINEFPYDKMIYNEEYNCFIIYKGEQTGVIDINGN